MSEAGALGAAIIAAAGAGEFSSIAEGAAAMVSTGRRFDPDPVRVRAYGERYERYRALWPAMRDLLATSIAKERRRCRRPVYRGSPARYRPAVRRLP